MPLKDLLNAAAVAAVASCAMARPAAAGDIPQPPPLTPADAAKPTAQAVTVAGLTRFVPDVVAVCDGRKITKAELVKLVGKWLEMGIARGQTFSEDQLRKMLREQVQTIVNQRLVTALVKADGYEPDVAAAKQELADAREKNGAAQVDAFIRMQGATEEEFVARLGERMAVQRWVGETLRQKAVVKPAQVDAYYAANPSQFTQPEKVHAAHILLKVDKDASADKKAATRKKLAAVRQRIIAGEDFAAVAKEVSEGPSAAKGGDLGTFERGRMVPPFEKAAFALQPGQLSDVVETRFGFHIIKVLDRQAGGKMPLDEKTRAGIRKRLTDQQISAMIQELLDKTAREKKVKIFL